MVCQTMGEGGSGHGERFSDSGCIFKIETAEFPNRHM